MLSSFHQTGSCIICYPLPSPRNRVLSLRHCGGHSLLRCLFSFVHVPPRAVALVLNLSASAKKMPGKCTFNASWLKKATFKNWLQACRGNQYKAYCSLCKKLIDVSNMGEAAVSSHSKSKKHLDLVDIAKNSLNMKEFITVSSSSSLNSDNSAAVSSSVNIENGSKPQNNWISGNQVLSSEVLWVLKVVHSHYSYSSCSNINEVFKEMFPDSQIANQLTCGEKKCAYLASFGIAPYFKSLLTKSVKEQESFVLLFDETLNHKVQQKQMDYYVRIWEGDKIVTKYLDSSFLGHATSQIMLEDFINCASLNSLPLGNIFQLSMDGPNVNWSFYDLLQDFLKKNYNCQILNTGSCGLHIVHNAFKAGAEASGWRIDSLLSNMYYHFKDSPARREDFVRITKSDQFALKFCSHRWVENILVSERAQKIWPNFIQYIKAVLNGKLKINQNKSFENLKEFSNDFLVPAKLACFMSVARLINPFLVKYQTDMPMLPFLYHDMLLLLKNILSMFIKASVLDNCSSVVNILNLNLDDVKIHLEYSKVDVGILANKILSDLKRSQKISAKEYMEFKLQAKTFLLKTTGKLLDKNPLRFLIVRDLVCLNPTTMREEKEMCIKKFKKVISVLMHNRRIKEDVCDNAAMQFRSFIHEAGPFFAESPIKPLDSAYYEHLNGKTAFKDMWQVIKSLLLLSHGQASIERGFSVNKKIEVENMKKETYVSQRLINDHIRSVGGVFNVARSKELLHSAALARQKYFLYLEDEKRLKKTGEKNQKKAQIQQEIGELKMQLKNFESVIAELEKSADVFAIEAEKNHDFASISKSNSLRKSASEKKVLVKNLKSQIDVKLEEIRHV